MSLNLNEYKSQGASSYSSSPEYVDAVNDAQVVRTFSFIALAGSVLIFLGGFLAVGVGIAVMVFGSKRFYRILGLAVVILSIGSFFVPILRLISSVVLCVGVIWKAGAILSTLAGVGSGAERYRDPGKWRVVGTLFDRLLPESLNVAGDSRRNFTASVGDTCQNKSAMPANQDSWLS